MDMQNIQYIKIPKLKTKTSQRNEASINKNNNNKSLQLCSQYLVVSSIPQILSHELIF